MKIVSLFLLFGILNCSSGTSSKHIVEAIKADRVMYTQTNLHPDTRQKKMYTTNYQRNGLIPVCSKVKFTSQNRKVVKFKVLKTGAEYMYVFHNVGGLSFAKNLKRYFGSSCPKKAMSKLTKKDKKGVKSGRVTEGMTKGGVKIAIGYPPVHETPDMNGDTWKYWKNRFNTFELRFKKGRVDRIVD